jgi:hypothetical protein
MFSTDFFKIEFLGHRLRLQRPDVDRDSVHLLQVPRPQILIQTKPLHQSYLSRTQVNNILNLVNSYLYCLRFWSSGNNKKCVELKNIGCVGTSGCASMRTLRLRFKIIYLITYK